MFGRFEVATCGGCRVLSDRCQTCFCDVASDQTELWILSLYSLRTDVGSLSVTWRVLLGISQQFGMWSSPPVLTCVICTKTSPRYGDHWRRQNLGRPFENWRSEGHKSNVRFAVYRPMLPDHSHWFRGRDILGYCLVHTQLHPAPGTGDFCHSGESRPGGRAW